VGCGPPYFFEAMVLFFTADVGGWARMDADGMAGDRS